MNKSHSMGSGGNIVSTIGSADISATINGIGNAFGFLMEGEVQDLAGVLNNDAAYVVRARETAEGIFSEGEWGYYAQALAGESDRLL